ncbi:MAG: LysM peptidoglycan-binding domain-containing protein, partial [Burkholderiaceae bacterium]
VKKTEDTLSQIKINAIDTIQLSSVKGISSSDTTKITAPNTMNRIGSIPIEFSKDSLSKKDTSSLITRTENTALKIEYPKGKFKANQLLAIYATAGSSFLDIANTYNVALYKLYNYNDLAETDLVAKDQILYLVPKRKEINKKVHLVVAGERLYEISQNEGIQLNYLQTYNVGVTDKTLVVGSTLVLFKTNEAPKISAAPIKSINPPSFFKRKKK